MTTIAPPTTSSTPQVWMNAWLEWTPNTPIKMLIKPHIPEAMAAGAVASNKYAKWGGFRSGGAGDKRGGTSAVMHGN